MKTTIKIVRLLLVLYFFGLATPHNSFARQGPLRIDIRINNPVSPFLTQAVSTIGKSISVTVSRISANDRNPYMLKVVGSLEHLSQRPFKISLDPLKPQNGILMAPGTMVLPLNYQSFEQAFGSFNESNFLAPVPPMNEFKEGANYKLPEGEYQICFSVYDNNGPGIVAPGDGVCIF